MIKACDPESTLVLVWSEDPAVDKEQSKHGLEYLAGALDDPQSWRECLKMHDGATPTEWVMGITPPAELNTAEDLAGSNAKQWHIFLHSVRNIKNAGSLVDGCENRRPPVKMRGGVEYVDPMWLANVMRGPLRWCAKELGLITYRWNQMTEDDAKK